jgi:Family of unknown function (DUF6502)
MNRLTDPYLFINSPYMENEPAVLSALTQLLRPVIRLLLHLGVGYRAFAEVAKRVFVDVATRDYGLRGRPTNASRVTLLTGINRRDVSRLRAELSARPIVPTLEQSSALGRVLSGWHQDPEFVDAAGTPRELPATGAGSFATLLARYGGDIPETATAKELRRVGAVASTADGKLKVQTRYYMPLALDDAALERYGSVVADLAGSINHNLFAADPNGRIFEGRAHHPHIDPAALEEFRALVDARGERLLEEIDAWLTEHALPASAKSAGVRLGVGLYLIDDTHKNSGSAV